MSKAAGCPGSRSVEFAGLNRFFLPFATGESTDAEYMVAGQVAPVVMETIAAWLRH